jgi:L-fuconate dehydratase
MHTDPDYSVVQAVRSLARLVEGEDCHNIWNDFAGFWRKITSESQMRWIGPEKGVIHLATAAIVNALWDLWARFENKPVWKLLVDLPPEKLVSTIDFRYISDVITPAECIQMLKEHRVEAEEEMKTQGFPAYTTQVGWLGYSDETVNGLCKEFLDDGFTSFKVKVGQNLEDDKKRIKLVRDAIGPDNNLMIDANQRWDVEEAIKWVTELQEFKPLWIEEPTSPDDILGHATIAKALKPLGIGVATGEMCQNRTIFKQLLQANAISFCQIDSCRLGGVNEVIAVYFMAKKFGIPVCPHAGGVGLCEMVQHLQIWDYISLTGEKQNRVIEWIDHLHEHFTSPPIVRRAHYIAPKDPGYSTEIKLRSIETYEFPNGKYWSSTRAE